MHADFAWLTEHSQEIHDKYAGKWIAVLNGEVIGVGDIATDAIEQAEAKHPGANYILESVDSDLECI
ncbi:MAG: hypothetical protein C4547_14590 [Phycisphaerales bacterium]|nr:MAG: hypothetical protein C4547_14590 [Phycisphaerales bacterium]